MAEPSKKSPGMEVTLDNLTSKAFGRKRTDSIRADICVDCGGEAKAFRDELSQKEFTISGLCQHCQDRLFS